jgi:hypothetical protein
MKDDDHARDYEFIPNRAPDDATARERRMERALVDIDQSLKDIKMLLGHIRNNQNTERDRVDQLEREFVEHRKYVDELTVRRRKAAGRK